MRDKGHDKRHALRENPEDGDLSPMEKRRRCFCPKDPRFPNMNQTRRCFVNFVDYQKCIRLLGPYQGCRIFKICYETNCPKKWINKWYEQMENGTFPMDIYPPKPDNLQHPDESETFITLGY